MYSWDQLFNIVTKCFRSSLWECRVASAELLSALLEITNKSFHEHFELLFSRSSGKMKDNFDACATLLNNVDLCQIELDYNVLLGYVLCIYDTQILTFSVLRRITIWRHQIEIKYCRILIVIVLIVKNNNGN